MRILVIEAGALHLGYLGCYGNDWVATPNLDRLAVEGITFDWHYADQPELQPITPWTERSVGTGRYQFPGQAPVGQTFLSAEAPAPRIVRCKAITALASDVVNALEPAHAWVWIDGPSLLPPWRLEEDLLEAYFDEDDAEEGLAPWFAPPLGLAKLTEAEVVRLQNTYAAAVTVFDAQLGVLLERGLPDDLLLCVTARSGLPLGEHGMIGTPQPLLHDELVHVPMLLRVPGGADAGLRIAALTQPVDLLPTFLEALGQPLPPMHGRSLWPLLRGEVESVRPYAVSALRVGVEESWLLRTPEWAFHLPVDERTPQLFVKPDDRWEVNDLYQQQIERADPMARTLRAFAEAIRQPGALTYPAIDEPDF